MYLRCVVQHLSTVCSAIWYAPFYITMLFEQNRNFCYVFRFGKFSKVVTICKILRPFILFLHLGIRAREKIVNSRKLQIQWVC